MSDIRVHVDVPGDAETTPTLRLTRWTDSRRRSRVSVQVRNGDGSLEAEVNVSLDDLVSAVDALVARPR